MPHPDMSESWVNGHPDEGLLHEWLDEQLSADHAKAVETHVAGCADCGALVAEARGLIAASHRILSALDDVPANVIPAQLPSAPADKTVVSLASAREAANARRAVQASKRSSRWMSFGKVAAVLLVAVVPGFMLLRGDDVTLPRSQPETVPPAASSDASAAPAASEARSVSATDSVAIPSTVAAEVAANRQRFAREMQKSADAERTASPPAGASRAEADRRVMTASPPSTAAATPAKATTTQPTTAQAQAQARAAQANVLADSLALSRVQASAGAALLSGRVAGAVVGSAAGIATPPVATPPVVAADQVSQFRSSAGGGRGVGAVRGAVRGAETSPATPLPQVSNAPTGPVANTAAPARADSAGINRAIADAAKRLAAAAIDSGNRLRQSLSMRRLASAENRSPLFATFDSVTLTRTICGTACETAVLHVSNLGAIRYSVSSGSSTKPTVTSQLSPTDRQRIGELLGAAISESVSLAGQHRCTVSRVTGAPALEVVIANGVGNGARADAACTTSTAVLLQLGAAIDSVAGIGALRRRVP